MEDTSVLSSGNEILQVLTQLGAVVLLAVIVELRGLIHKWFQKLISKVEMETNYMLDHDAKQRLHEALDVGIGAVAEWARRVRKEDGDLYDPEPKDKLEKARDTIVSYLGREGLSLKDFKLSEADLDDLIHAKLIKLRPMLNAGDPK